MYHRFRSWHRWVGAFAAIGLLLIAVTGFLLATKKTVDWIRPSEREGQAIGSLVEVVSVHVAAEAAFSLGLAELSNPKQIDRIDYRPGDNVFKVVSKEGYHEVQVDGKTGKVLNLAKRNDQFVEDLHDLSWFADLAHKWLLPCFAVALTFLAASGIGIFVVPFVRRWKFRHGKKP